ncbi:uncharacterized protein [Battus philenor]|uniref:uncharacterized protein isoform X2 n=1 Tax=Battus philenor TaxID=42288 RepID=UPI0035D050D9
MNFPFKKNVSGVKKKKQKFEEVTDYIPTNNHFWADIASSSFSNSNVDATQNVNKNIATSIVQQNEEPFLNQTNVHTPALPLDDTNVQGSQTLIGKKRNKKKNKKAGSLEYKPTINPFWANIVGNPNSDLNATQVTTKQVTVSQVKQNHGSLVEKTVEHSPALLLDELKIHRQHTSIPSVKSGFGKKKSNFIQGLQLKNIPSGADIATNNSISNSVVESKPIAATLQVQQNQEPIKQRSNNSPCLPVAKPNIQSQQTSIVKPGFNKKKKKIKQGPQYKQKNIVSNSNIVNSVAVSKPIAAKSQVQQNQESIKKINNNSPGLPLGESNIQSQETSIVKQDFDENSDNKQGLQYNPTNFPFNANVAANSSVPNTVLESKPTAASSQVQGNQEPTKDLTNNCSGLPSAKTNIQCHQTSIVKPVYSKKKNKFKQDLKYKQRNIASNSSITNSVVKSKPIASKSQVQRNQQYINKVTNNSPGPAIVETNIQSQETSFGNKFLKKNKTEFKQGWQYKQKNIPFWVDVDASDCTLNSNLGAKQKTAEFIIESQQDSTNQLKMPFVNKQVQKEQKNREEQNVNQNEKSNETNTTLNKPSVKIEKNIPDNNEQNIVENIQQEPIKIESEDVPQIDSKSTQQSIKINLQRTIKQEVKVSTPEPEADKPDKRDNLDSIESNVAEQKAAKIPVLSNMTAKNKTKNKCFDNNVQPMQVMNNTDYPAQIQNPVHPILMQNPTGPTLTHAPARTFQMPQQTYPNIYNTENPNYFPVNNTFQTPVVQGPPESLQNYPNIHYQGLNSASRLPSAYVSTNPMPVYPGPYDQMQPTYVQQPPHNVYTENFTNAPTYVNTDIPGPAITQPYSPSEIFNENREDSTKEDAKVRAVSSSPDMFEPGQKRLSAFKRLGPLTQTKKPKLTINVSLGKEHNVREVVGETQEPQIPECIPFHEREDIVTSSDEIVKRYLPHWPWKNRIIVKREVSARVSKSAMMMEQEQMEEIYENNNIFVQVAVKGYPSTWTKEDVLDTLLENLAGKSFIPCFIEFTPLQCKFLVVRCRSALVAIHKLGFCVQKYDVVLSITISNINMSLKNLDFTPKYVLQKRIAMGIDNETKLSLKAFTLQSDISHFIYFPLNRVNNQMGIMELRSYHEWRNLRELDLSDNRLTTLDGFDLQQATPQLYSLNISNNYIAKITVLLQCRELPLKSLTLEGNPLCTDYTNPDDYVKVLRMMFPMLKKIDGLPVVLKGNMPLIQKNFCFHEAKDVVEKFLEVYFPIIDSEPSERYIIKSMYDNDAILTITHQPKLGLSAVHWHFRSLFNSGRKNSKNEKDCVTSKQNIVKFLSKWPNLKHDPTTFTVDVLWHSDTTTILRVGGVVKITSETLAVDEHVLAFTRTFLLHTSNGCEYKIRNEMLYWELPTDEYTKNAFRITLPKSTLTTELKTPPDKIMKENLIKIFMKLTELERSPSKRCLEEKDWNLKDALDFFVKLVKLIHIDVLYDTPVSK